MSHQLTFADSEFSTKRRQTRKRFSSPHGADSAMAKHGGSHRAVLSQGGQWPTAYPLETMLRIHCMQHWYNLSDGAMEDACTKSPPCACLPDYPG
ncbi:Putative transposase (identified by ISEscan HMM) [Klebsiella pneumoniae]|nr:Putative transposase (identified by ISEscan HMM) [Klebsiella pneumoniae]